MDATAFLPEGAAASWSIYFGVEDTDIAIANAEDLGGSVILPPQHSPFGRLAQVADSSGAPFKISSAS
ncbi:MAG: hypothetical protein ACR2KG_02745 [Nocardioidaceae bacterium]